MKKLLNFIVILGVLSPTTTTFVKGQTNDFENVNQYILQKDGENNFGENRSYRELHVTNRYKMQRTILSRYKNKVGEPSDFNDQLDEFVSISAGERNKWLGLTDKLVTEINVSELGYDSKEELLRDYRELEISYNSGYNFTNNGKNGWKNGDKGVEMGTPDAGAKVISLRSNEISINVVDEEYQHTNSSKHRIRITLTGRWVGNYKYEVKFDNLGSLDYNKGSLNGHATYAGFKAISAILI